jgi:hypothetical protein
VGEELTRPVLPTRSAARAHMYAYAVNVWDLSIVQGPFSVAPDLPALRFATFLHRKPRCQARGTRCTAMKKLRIVILGFGTARQRMVLK